MYYPFYIYQPYSLLNMFVFSLSRSFLAVIFMLIGLQPFSVFAKRITNIQLEIKQVGGAFVPISNLESVIIPLVAGDTYVLRLKGDSLSYIQSRFPSFEENAALYNPKLFEKTVMIPAKTERGTSYFLNVYNKAGNSITLNFEIVMRGRVEMIQYKDAETPKQKNNIDIVKANSLYQLYFQGDGMEFATMNVARFPMLISGTFITLYAQQMAYEKKGMLLKIRIGNGEKNLTTSLLYFLNNIGIRDKNAKIDLPWTRYVIGSGEVFKPMLPVNMKEHLTDLTIIQME